jgi:hypothetical protein
MERVTERAGFPGSYNFPIFTIGNKLWAFHDQGKEVRWKKLLPRRLEFRRRRDMEAGYGCGSEVREK